MSSRLATRRRSRAFAADVQVARAERAVRIKVERAAASLARLQAITWRLSGALTSSQVATVVVEESVAALGGSAGVLLVPSADGEALELAGSAFVPDHLVDKLKRLRMDSPFPLVEAFRTRTPEVIESSPEADAFGAIVCIPLLLERTAVGVLGVMFASARQFSEEECSFASTIARQCAPALDRARLYELEIRSNQALRLLAQAGDALSSSLEEEETLQNIAHLMLPALGDFCFFDVLEGDHVRRIARARPQAGSQASPGQDHETEAQIARVGLSRAPDDPLKLSALSTGQSGFHPEIDERWMQRAAVNPEQLSAMRALGLCSMITVAMIARKEMLGALTLCFAASGRHHTPIDFVLAEELARRTAIALENARLHHASQNATLRAQEANRLLEQANRAKDEFLSVVSHELRTPLNAILGWAQLLSGERGRDPQFVHKGVAVIERNARVQVKLIEDILDVSRIISGKLRLEPRPLDLDAVVRASIEVIHPTADARGVALIVSSAPGVIVSGDPDRLQQVVWNLLANAVKFTPKGGSVEIRLLRTPRSGSIIVRDSGKGIDLAFLPYVFERFRQADSSTTRRHGGLGLGLSIVRHVVELHGGTVRAESEGPDKGATFIVKLPLRAERIPGREPLPRVALESDPNMVLVRLDGLRVLIVDDELDAREMVATLLTVCGADVTGVSSSSEALARLAATGADVLVSDLGLPGDDGYALIRQIRASSACYSRIPALALTAYAAPDDARRAVLAGFHAHLAKPAEPAALTALVASLGGRSAAPAS